MSDWISFDEADGFLVVKTFLKDVIMWNAK